jgi:ribonucleoside-diphosphate reductase beta chain
MPPKTTTNEVTESNHIALGRYILRQLITENPDLWTPAFQAELLAFMREGVELEKEFLRDSRH